MCSSQNFTGKREEEEEDDDNDDEEHMREAQQKSIERHFTCKVQ